MQQTITVSQLTRYIKQIFDAEELLYNISVVGEISGIKIVRNIAYFDLKDEFSLISSVCFDGLLCENLKNGDKIIVTGSPNFYMKSGKLNFIVSKVQPYGIGDLYQQFLNLKKKLEQEGLFDNRYKKSIPKFVKNIGVISSETGAVIQDIITVATRRDPRVNIVLYPAKVQGEGTVQSIIKGLDFFETYKVDVVIIARGGGSFEDLNEFNNEKLARRIFAFSKPIVSAVGHETDFTICDFVADVRGATPSVAAELVIENISNYRQILTNYCKRICYLIDKIYEEYEDKIQNYKTCIIKLIENYLFENDYLLTIKKKQIEKYDQNDILNRGFSIIEKEGKIVKSVKSLDKNNIITITLKDGSVKGEIK